MLQDLRFSVRQLARFPVASAVALITLTLAVGVNTAIFSVVHAVLLRPLPWVQPERLVTLWATYPHWQGREILHQYWDRIAFAWPEFERVRDGSTTLESIAIYATQPVTVAGVSAPEIVTGGLATHELLDVLGVVPSQGRWLVAADDRPGAPAVAVVRHEYWRSRWGGEPSIVGRAVRIDGDTYTIVGVLPPGFAFTSPDRPATPPEIWTPIGRLPAPMRGEGNHSFEAIGRLARDTPIERVLAEAAPLMRGNRAPDRFGARVLPRLEAEVGAARPGLLLLLASVGLVLLIACVNLINLRLGQLAGRDREIAIRLALGASRARVARLGITESLLLGALGGAAGLALAWPGTRALVALLPADLPRVASVELQLPALAFALSVSLAVGVVTGVVPARRRAQPAVMQDLRAGSAAAAGARLQRALIVAEVALAVTLVVGGGLLARSLWRVLAVDPGFRAEGRLTFNSSPPPWRYESDEQVGAFLEQLHVALAALPGVRGVAATSNRPLSGLSSTSLEIPSLGLEPDAPGLEAERRVVTPSYFAVMGIPVERGRGLTARDALAGAAPVVVVSRGAAERLWGGRDPLGDQIVANRRTWTVVGIVGDVVHRGLDADAESTVYYPLGQYPRRSWTTVVHTEIPPLELVPAIRGVVAAQDPELPVAEVRTMPEVVSGASAAWRHRAILLGAFALLALVLACVGIYGVTAHAVAVRSRELGIRIALGADGRRIRTLVLREVGRCTVVGVAIGLALAWLTGGVVERFLFGVPAVDAVSYLAASLIAVAVSLLAGSVPARRAAAVEPIVALQAD